MLRKPQEEEFKQSGNRITLPEESGIRTVAGFKEFLAMAEGSKGSQFELCWTTKTPGQRFVLDIQWEPSKKAPLWTLYEVKEDKSRRIWDEPLTIANIDMCYDVLVMTCGGVDPSTKNLAEILKAQANKDDEAKGAKGLPKSGPNSVPEEVSVVVSKSANEATAANNVSQNIPPSQPMLPGYGYPPGMGFPMSAYNAPPQNMPMPNMPAYTPNVPYPNQPMPPNAWQYGVPVNPNMYGQPNMPMAPMPAPNQGMLDGSQHSSNALMNAPGMMAGNEGSLINLPVDNALLDKQRDISVIDLLVKAELITEMTMDAVLKVQDLIHDGKITHDKAADILKHLHNKGDKIENYINAPPSITASGNFSPPKAQQSLQNEEDQAAFALLLQAGLISQDDLKLAHGVISKHGGDVVSILQAAQKLDKKTFEAATICCALQKEGLFKIEQSVIIVNYSSRSRVSFDEALAELNWPDPRQQATR